MHSKRLNMVLNYEEIKAKSIIENAADAQFGDGSYNLTVEKVIDMENKVHDFFTLKPQGMVYVVFKEKLKVPSDVIGFAHVKTSLTQLGIMATNIGIIDPNYNGYISTLLINFGKADHFICLGDPALRVTFANLTIPRTPKELKFNNLDLVKYQKNVQKNIANLDVKFLNLNAVKNEVTWRIFKFCLGLAVFFTVGTFGINVYFNNKNSSEKNLENSIKKYELGLSTLAENNKLLQEQLKVNDTKINILNDSITAQAAQIRKLKK